MSAYQRMMSGLLGGYMDPEEEKRLSEQQRQAAQQRGIADFGAAMLAGSGPSPFPTSFGQIAGQALQAGRQGYAQSGQQSAMAQKQQAEAARMAQWIATLPEKAQAYARQFPDEAAKMYREMGVNAAMPQKPAAKFRPLTRAEKVQAGYDPALPLQVNETTGEIKGVGGVSVTNNIGGGAQPGLLSVEEAEAMGLPTDRRFQRNDKGKLELVSGTSPQDLQNPAMNARQEAGMRVRNSAALDYASNLTGISKDELSSMSPEDVEAAIVENGRRITQGGVARAIGGIPFVGNGIVETINPDLAPFASQMAAGQVSVNNPAGDTGERAFDLAARQVPGPTIDLAVQAQMIRKMLEEERAGPAGRSQVQQPRILRRVR